MRSSLKVLGATAFALTVPIALAHSQAYLNGIQQPVGVTQDQLAAATDYLGPVSITALPDPVANAGKRVLAMDLGGGPGYLRATNGCWKRVATTTAQVQNITVGTTITIDGLANSPVVGLTGSGFAAKATITITNPCSVPLITVVSPSGVFGALGSLGIGVGNGTPLSVAGIGTSGLWSDYAVSSDGTTLTKIRGGSL